MVAEALGAYAHFLSVFTMVSLLAAEAAHYRQRMTPATLALLRRLDLGYGIAAGAVIVTGLLRVSSATSAVTSGASSRCSR